MKDSIRKTAAIFLLFSPIIFLIFSTIGMFLYPGGYSINGAIFYPPYYKFSKNMFSDLGMLTTVTGKSNLPSAILFCTGMSLVGLSFIFHAATLRSYFTKNTIQYKLVKFASIAAIISAMGFIGVGFTPWDIFLILHEITVVIGFGASLVYSLLLCIAIFKEKSYPNINGILSILYIITVLVYMTIILVGPPWDSFPGRTYNVLAQKVVGYVIMFILPVEAIGSLFLIKKNSDQIQ